MKTPDSIHCRPGTTDAMQRLADENEALRAERDELAARAARFRDALDKCADQLFIDRPGDLCSDAEWDACALLAETPAQSLSHIRAAGAREALERAMQPKGFSDTVVRVDRLQEIINQMEVES